MGEQDFGVELEMLKKALALEIEATRFFTRMVSELADEERRLFSRFVEIESGHEAIVQAEIDAVTGLGFWFDYTEFRLEGA
jgi:rubrerythrin